MRAPFSPLYGHKLSVGDKVHYRADEVTPWSKGIWTVSEIAPTYVFIVGGTFGMSVPMLHAHGRLRLA